MVVCLAYRHSLGIIILVAMKEIENTSWKVLAYGIYARVVDVPARLVL